MKSGNMTVAALSAAVVFGITAPAQTPPVLLRVTQSVVKPDRVGEYLEIQKQYAAIYKKAGIPFRFVFRTAAGNVNEFWSIAPIENYAAIDNQTPLSKGAPEGDLARLTARLQQCVETTRVTYDRPLTDLYIGAMGAPPPVLRVVHTRVKPGMSDQYIALLKSELVPALKKAGVALFRAREVEYGGPRTDFYTASGLTKFADLDGENLLVKAMGADWFKSFLEKAAALTATSATTLLRPTLQASREEFVALLPGRQGLLVRQVHPQRHDEPRDRFDAGEVEVVVPFVARLVVVLIEELLHAPARAGVPR